MARTLNPRPFQCPRCLRPIYLASSGFEFERCHRGPWHVKTNGELHRPGDGYGSLTLHHCKETM